MRYHFTVKTTGYYRVAVEAESKEEALKKASEEWSDADFGELEDVDTESDWITEE